MAVPHRGLVLALALIGLGSWSGLGQVVPPGFDAAGFARIGIGVRAMAMAGAVVAVAEGPSAGYWNPACLSGLVGFQAEGMYTNWLGADIQFQHLGAAGYPPLGDPRPSFTLHSLPLTFALNWISVRVANIPWMEEDGAMGTFDAWSHAVLVSVGITLSPSLALGLSAKVYHDRILEGQSLGLGLDAGLLWRFQVWDVPMQFGVCSTDLGGTKVQWYGTTGEPVNYVPWLMRAGIAAEFQIWEARLLCTASYEWGVDRPRFERARVGLEGRVAWLALRAGWDQARIGDPGRWSLGLGVTPWPWASLDYAFVPGPLGTSHLLSLRLLF